MLPVVAILPDPVLDCEISWQPAEAGVGFRDCIILAAFVTMPEASVNKNNGTVLGKDNVRFTWEIIVVQPVSETISPEGVTKYQLRLSGSGADSGHVTMALIRSKTVRHILYRQKYDFIRGIENYSLNLCI